MPLLEVTVNQKTFGTETEAKVVLKNVRLDIGSNEIVTIIGPSGCGKSTLLKMIAGLDLNFEGRILLDGVPITRPSIEKGVIFQEPRLFPWLTVEQNIAADFSLRDPEIRKKVNQIIQLVRLDGFETAYPKQLSGGMAQRVAIARALLRKPRILLLDEPFGALDAFTRAHLQDVLLQIWKEEKVSMVFITHDIDEAVYLGNRVAIMRARPGEIQRVIQIDHTFPRIRSSKVFQEYRHRVVTEFEAIEELALVDRAGI
ncbi:MAG: ABC transporter ATP-binding protein [Bacilli bacterium]